MWQAVATATKKLNKKRTYRLCVFCVRVCGVLGVCTVYTKVQKTHKSLWVCRHSKYCPYASAEYIFEKYSNGKAFGCEAHNGVSKSGGLPLRHFYSRIHILHGSCVCVCVQSEQRSGRERHLGGTQPVPMHIARDSVCETRMIHVNIGHTTSAAAAVAVVATASVCHPPFIAQQHNDPVSVFQ